AMMEDFQRNYRAYPEVKTFTLGHDHHSFPGAAQYGVSADGPYLGLLAACDVAEKDKFRLLAQTRWRKDRGTAPEDFIAFDFRKAMGYEKPASAEELYRVVERLNDAGEHSTYGGNGDFYKALVNTEIYAYLKLEKREALDIEKLSELSGQSAKNDRDLKS